MEHIELDDLSPLQPIISSLKGLQLDEVSRDSTLLEFVSEKVFIVNHLHLAY